MTTVDPTVPEFNIVVDLLVSSETGNLLLLALAATLVAGAWLGMRIYLHRYGARTEGTVKEAFVKSTTVSSPDFSASSRMRSHYLKIEYTGPDRVKRIIKGSRYASELDDKEQASLQVGGRSRCTTSSAGRESPCIMSRFGITLRRLHRWLRPFFSSLWRSTRSRALFSSRVPRSKRARASIPPANKGGLSAPALFREQGISVEGHEEPIEAFILTKFNLAAQRTVGQLRCPPAADLRRWASQLTNQRRRL